MSDLRAARITRGLTLGAVASLVKVTKTRIARIEVSTSKRVMPMRMRILNALLKVPLLTPRTAGDAIYAARLIAGMPVVRFAELLGVHTKSVSLWESDHHTPSLRLRKRLFAEVGLDLRAFFPDDVYDESERGDAGRFAGLVLDATLTPAAGEVCA